MTVEAVAPDELQGGSQGQGGYPALQFGPEISSLLARKGFEVRHVSAERVPLALEVEVESFPPDEAADLKKLTTRQKKAGAFFVEANLTAPASVDACASGEGPAVAREMVAIICSTLCRGKQLTHESMYVHDPEGETLCIHAVAVRPKYRRRGYATTLMKAYLEYVSLNHPGVRYAVLMSKAHLLGMYASCGFSIVGLSPVVLGKDQWFEMLMDFDAMEPRALRFVQVDSFTDKVFGGNPAAVFFTHNGGDEKWMQQVAREMQLSETCFLELRPQAGGAEPGREGPLYALRWFTPAVEVDLCGHATLAAAHALWEDGGRVDPSLPIRFSTRVGVLTCRRDAEGWVEMDFPAEDVSTVLDLSGDTCQRLQRALGPKPEDGAILFVGRNRWDILVEVKAGVLDSIEPDMKLLATVECRGVIVTCEARRGQAGSQSTAEGSEMEIDFRSRFFAPRAGIDEDPVTGSAHTCLAPYWSKKLQRKGVLVGYQASKRGGIVRVEYLQEGGDGSVGAAGSGGRVLVSGKAVTVLSGFLRRS